MLELMLFRLLEVMLLRLLEVMLLRVEVRLAEMLVRLEGSVGVRGGVLKGELSIVINSGIGLMMVLTGGFRITAKELFETFASSES